MVISIILLAISVGSGAYFLYKLNKEVKEGFANISIPKTDSSDVIKVVEDGVNQILIKVDNQTESITESISERIENLTIEIHE